MLASIKKKKNAINLFDKVAKWCLREFLKWAMLVPNNFKTFFGN
jgi:hypothetical protein